MKRVIINVTAKDIENAGYFNKPNTCPIAQSFKRRGVNAYVDRMITVGVYYLPLPPVASKFVTLADATCNKGVAPFKFALDVPDDVAVMLQRKRSHRALQRHLEA